MGIRDNYWDWQPLVSIGPFRFGESATHLIQEYDLQKLEKPFEEADWCSYEFPDCETRIYTNENLEIERVGCFDNIYYRGRNLFGLMLNEVRSILGKEDECGEAIMYDVEDNRFEIFSVEFEKFSAQIWFKNGVVDSAMVHGFLDDDQPMKSSE
jgi:hypothetical protein